MKSDTTFNTLLDDILEFELEGILYEWLPPTEDKSTLDDRFKELPPSKRGFKADIMSFILNYFYRIKPRARELPRSKKRKLRMHFRKKTNKLKRAIERMY